MLSSADESVVTAGDIGWVAGVIDSRATLFVRHSATGAPLASVTLTVAAERRALVERLCALTGVTVVQTRKDYNRSSCSEHCPEKHVHISNDYYRWSLTGARALVVLRLCLPYLTVRSEQAAQMISECRETRVTSAPVARMRALGWSEPVHRVELESPVTEWSTGT